MRLFWFYQNMAFFMVHGVAVCASVWATRKLPNLTGSNWFFNFVLLQIFVIATTPLCEFPASYVGQAAIIPDP